jgi:hypothetical protein
MRFFGLGARNGSPLEADLRRVTDADLIDVPPKDLMTSIVQATHDEGDRRVLMRHLNECLTEKSGDRWRRVHGGLVLLQQVLQRGSRMLIGEIAEGRHCDLIQQLTFLENFAYTTDLRVQSMVRQKASVLRSELKVQMEEAQNMPSASCSSSYNIAQPVHVVEGVAKSSQSALTSSSQLPRSQLVNGIVTVGHRDDTDSDEAEAAPAAARPSKSNGVGKHQRNGASERSQLRAAERRRNVLEESTDSDASSNGRGRKPQNGGASASKTSSVTPAAVAAAPAVAEVNLLDFESAVHSKKTEVNLLDF